MQQRQMPSRALTVWQRLAALPSCVRLDVRERAWAAIVCYRQEAGRTFVPWEPEDVAVADALLLIAVAAAEALLAAV